MAKHWVPAFAGTSGKSDTSMIRQTWKAVAVLALLEPALACSCDREIAHNITQHVPMAFVA